MFMNSKIHFLIKLINFLNLSIADEKINLVKKLLKNLMLGDQMKDML